MPSLYLLTLAARVDDIWFPLAQSGAHNRLQVGLSPQSYYDWDYDWSRRTTTGYDKLRPAVAKPKGDFQLINTLLHRIDTNSTHNMMYLLRWIA